MRILHTVELDPEPSLTLEVCLKSQHMNINLLHRISMKLVFQAKLRFFLMRTIKIPCAKYIYLKFLNHYEMYISTVFMFLLCFIPPQKVEKHRSTGQPAAPENQVCSIHAKL